MVENLRVYEAFVERLISSTCHHFSVSLLEHAVVGECLLTVAETGTRRSLQTLTLSLPDKVVLHGVLATSAPALLAGTRWSSPVILGSMVGSTSFPSGRRPCMVSRLGEIINCISIYRIEVGCSSSRSHLLLPLRSSQCLFLLKLLLSSKIRSRIWG